MKQRSSVLTRTSAVNVTASLVMVDARGVGRSRAILPVRGEARSDMASVFVVQDGGQVVPMKRASFAAEDQFQKLLAEHPDLLAGDQIDPASPRRWMLLARELAVPSEGGGFARWFVDHLFVDQDAVPTIVEVKRQSNPELRREVVGQLLEYAANATSNWRVDELRQKFQEANEDADTAISDRLGYSGDVNEFWQTLKTNLQAGRVRLLFVSDYIPPELRLIVEFLNQQMDPAEVLALELRQFEGAGMKTIVPLVYGQTQEAQQKKKPGAAKVWTEEEVSARIQEKLGDDFYRVAREIVAWFRQMGAEVSPGGGARGSFRFGIKVGERKFTAFTLWVWESGYIEVAFHNMRNSCFKDANKRTELLAKLNKIEGLGLPADAIDKFPSVPLKLLLSEANRTRFFEAAGWFLKEVVATHGWVGRQAD